MPLSPLVSKPKTMLITNSASAYYIKLQRKLFRLIISVASLSRYLDFAP